MSADPNTKWPEYLIQWRTSLWVSIREKESNVWKFVAFYGSAISLIIGLGQKLATTLDLAIDVTVIGAIVGLLTFWGLAIVIDSNSWMSRNLKLIGNIEKIFIPGEEYGKLIPGYYSSPLFRYFRPYTVFFFFLSVLGALAFINFIAHLPKEEQGWRIYLLPLISGLYALGFHKIQVMDEYTRKEYFRFFKSARGKPIAIGAETMPPEYWEFKLATNARFQRLALIVETFIVVVYGLKEQAAAGSRYTLILVVLNALLFVAVSSWFSFKLSRKEEDHRAHEIAWPALGAEPLLKGKWRVESASKFYFRFAKVSRWALLIGMAALILFSYSGQIGAFLGPYISR